MNAGFKMYTMRFKVAKYVGPDLVRGCIALVLSSSYEVVSYERKRDLGDEKSSNL